MADLKDLLQSADWKTEKHVPAIDAPDKIKKGDILDINISVGKSVPHPNTTEHHIKFIELYFLPKDEKFPYHIGRFEFTTHGESTLGPNTSGIFSEPRVRAGFKTDKSGLVMAVSYCNIHGIWKNEKEIVVE